MKKNKKKMKKIWRKIGKIRKIFGKIATKFWKKIILKNWATKKNGEKSRIFARKKNFEKKFDKNGKKLFFRRKNLNILFQNFFFRHRRRRVQH